MASIKISSVVVTGEEETFLADVVAKEEKLVKVHKKRKEQTLDQLALMDSELQQAVETKDTSADKAKQSSKGVVPSRDHRELVREQKERFKAAEDRNYQWLEHREAKAIEQVEQVKERLHKTVEAKKVKSQKNVNYAQQYQQLARRKLEEKTNGYFEKRKEVENHINEVNQAHQEEIKEYSERNQGRISKVRNAWAARTDQTKEGLSKAQQEKWDRAEQRRQEQKKQKQAEIQSKRMAKSAEISKIHTSFMEKIKEEEAHRQAIMDKERRNEEMVANLKEEEEMKRIHWTKSRQEYRNYMKAKVKKLQQNDQHYREFLGAKCDRDMTTHQLRQKRKELVADHMKQISIAATTAKHASNYAMDRAIVHYKGEKLKSALPNINIAMQKFPGPLNIPPPIPPPVSSEFDTKGVPPRPTVVMHRPPTVHSEHHITPLIHSAHSQSQANPAQPDAPAKAQ